MAQSVLVFPYTFLSRAAIAGLAPWLQPVTLLEPPVLQRPPADAAPVISPALEQAGLLDLLSLPTAEQQGLAAQIRQWRQWVSEHKDSGMIEAVKAGVKPPPPPETWRNVMNNIRDFGKPEDESGGLSPLAQACMLLHLSHERDLQASEMEGIMAKVEAGQEMLGQVLGLEGADSSKADYQREFSDLLPPLGYSHPEGYKLEQRLAAWALCVAGLAGPDACLASASPEAAVLLMERANQRLRLRPGDFRSPAGAAMPMDNFQSAAGPDSPLAQEAARLVLPDLSALDDEQLIALQAPLEEVRGELAGLIADLSKGAWSADLQERISQAAKILAAKAVQAVAEAGVQAPSASGLSILAFPGLSRENVMALMKGEGDENLPAPEDWPDKWPQGSCPVVAAW